MPGWTIIFTPEGPRIVNQGGDPNPYADASLEYFLQHLPPEFQNEAVLSLIDWGDGGGGGGGVAVAWTDLVRESATDIGKQAIASFGNQIRMNGNPERDHIPAQNETGARFAATLAAYNAGQLSAADARAQINQWNNAFLLLTQQIGSARALKGGAEINQLAQRILTTLGGPGGSGTVIPPTGVPIPPMGTIPIAGMNISTTTLVAIAGLGVLLLMKKR